MLYPYPNNNASLVWLSNSIIYLISKHQLIWFFISLGELRFNYLPKQYSVTLGLFQMAILLQFNDETTLTGDEIRQRTKLEEKDWNRHVQPLIENKILVEVSYCWHSLESSCYIATEWRPCSISDLNVYVCSWGRLFSDQLQLFLINSTNTLLFGLFYHSALAEQL